jgi:hypothetical protein
MIEPMATQPHPGRRPPPTGAGAGVGVGVGRGAGGGVGRGAGAGGGLPGRASLWGQQDHQRACPEYDCGDGEGSPQAGGELARAAQGAGGGEDRAEHGDPQHGADLAQRVGGAGGDALKLLGSVAEGEPGNGREEETQAGAGDEEGRDEVAVGDGGSDLGGEPADADRLQRNADGDDPPSAEAVGEQARDGGGDGRGGGPGQAVDAGAERRVAHDRLQELGDQEDDAEHAHVGE